MYPNTGLPILEGRQNPGTLVGFGYSDGRSVRAGLWVFAPTLVFGLGQSEPVAWGLRWSAIYVYFVTLNGYQVGAMAGFEAFDAIAVISGCYGAARVLLTWLLAARCGFHGAVLAQGAGAVILWTLYHLALRRQCRKHGIE